MQLDDALRWRDQIAAVLADEADALGCFLSDDATHIVRTANRRESDPAGTSTNDMTSTAFALHMSLVAVGGRPEPERSAAVARMGIDVSAITDWLASEITSTYRPHADLGIDSDVRSGTDVLPNNYNTSIHIGGLVSALRALPDAESVVRQHSSLPEVLVGAAKRLTREITTTFQPANQTVTELVADSRNPYIWYWACVAAAQLRALFQDEEAAGWLPPVRLDHADDLGELLTAASDAAQHRMAELVAFHHSGVEGFTDATDFLFTLAVASRRSAAERQAASTELIDHGLAVFLERHVSAEGSIYPRSTAFVDDYKNAIVISSAEHCAVLADILAERSHDVPAALVNLVSYLLGRRSGRLGWGRHAGGGAGVPQRPIFVVSAALSFLASVHTLLQSIVSEQALLRSGLQARRPNDRIGKLNIDPTLQEMFETQIVAPIGRAARHEAALSLVLHGPPGTAKTTCAEKLAWMLGWPVVELSPAIFLREGMDRVDSVADQVFEQLGHLQDVVVLFDEFEEMIRERSNGSREGRFLTTSMLPRLHHIRDAGKIVFVIATNSIDAIDSAARRFGRVDMVLRVDYPSAELRTEMFENVVSQFPNALETVRKLRALGFPAQWRQPRDVPATVLPEQELGPMLEVLNTLSQLPEPLSSFGWGHIREVVRRGNAIERTGREITFDVIAGIVVSVSRHNNPDGDQHGQR